MLEVWLCLSFNILEFNIKVDQLLVRLVRTEEQLHNVTLKERILIEIYKLFNQSLN